MLFIYFMYDMNFLNTAYTNEKTNKPPTGVCFKVLYLYWLLKTLWCILKG